MADFTFKAVDDMSVSIDDGAIIDYVNTNLEVGDVFAVEELHDWAINNGYIEEP